MVCRCVIFNFQARVGIRDVGMSRNFRRGLLRSLGHSTGRGVCAKMAGDGKIEVRTVGVEGDGVIDFGALRDAVDESVAIVSIQWVNTETGVVQDVGAIGGLCRERGVVFHFAAPQWVGKMETLLEDRKRVA